MIFLPKDKTTHTQPHVPVPTELGLGAVALSAVDSLQSSYATVHKPAQSQLSGCIGNCIFSDNKPLKSLVPAGRGGP